MHTTQDELLNLYRTHLETLQFSQNTITNYLYLCRAFAQQEPTQEWAEAFIRQHNHGSARAFLKSFKEYLQLNYEVPKTSRRQAAPQTDYLTREEINQLVQGIPNTRFAILIQSLFETGCRISEALAWTPLNINFKNLTISGLGKGHKPYVVNISQDTADALLALSENMIHEKEFLFPFTRNWALTYLTRQAKHILDKHVHPHMLRHSTAMELKRKGMPIEDIKAYLRHSDISSTQRYAHAENQENVLQKARKILI